MSPTSLCGSQSFALSLGLEDVPASIDEVMVEIGDRLDAHRPNLSSRQEGRLVLTLTVEAADLWLAVLSAMASVTAVGYAPAWIEAGPSEVIGSDRVCGAEREA